MGNLRRPRSQRARFVGPLGVGRPIRHVADLVMRFSQSDFRRVCTIMSSGADTCRQGTDAMIRRFAVEVMAAAIICGVTASAGRADFTVCNRSDERASVSVGYRHADFGWTSEGWWNIPIEACVTIINGNLKSR